MYQRDKEMPLWLKKTHILVRCTDGAGEKESRKQKPHDGKQCQCNPEIKEINITTASLWIWQIELNGNKQIKTKETEKKIKHKKMNYDANRI